MAEELIVRLVKNKKELEKTFRLRYKVYCASSKEERPSDLRPEDYPDQMEKDLWDDYSIHFAAYFHKKIVGTVRLIKGAECPKGFLLESKFVLPEELDRSRGLEASRMIVDPETRHRGIRHKLDKTAMDWSVKNGYSWWCLAVQDYLLPSCYRAGWNILEVSGPARYHGTIVYGIIVYL